MITTTQLKAESALRDAACPAFDASEFTVTQRRRAEDALHFAQKHEQRVWGSGGEHEKARAEVERLEAILDSWQNIIP